MHLRTVWVATVGFVGGIGIYGGLGAVRNLVWVCCHLYRYSSDLSLVSSDSLELAFLLLFSVQQVTQLNFSDPNLSFW